MDHLTDALDTVRQLSGTDAGAAWRAYLRLKFEQLKERLVFEEPRDRLAAQAQLLVELLDETQPGTTRK